MNVQGTLQAAIAHHQAGRLAEAEALYRQILERVPQHADALHMLGLLAHQAGHHEMAVELIGQALRVAPGNAAGHSNLGLALLALGQADAAVASLRRALVLQPDFADAHLNLGNAWKAQGRLDQAVASYRAAIGARRKYPEAHYNLGLALLAQGQAREAVDAFRQAIALRPAYAEAHNGLGNALQALGEPEQAGASYERALKLRPGFAEAHNNLGLALQARGLVDEAIASLRRAIAIHPGYAEAHSNLGSQLEARGDLEEAAAEYRQALALQPGLAVAHNNLGNVLQAQGHLEEALASYRQAIAIRPDYADAHNNLGNALQAAGRLDEAVRSHDRAIELSPGDADAHWNKAFALLLKGDYGQGWPLFEWRWKALEQRGLAQRFAQPPWLGDAPVQGRTILLHHEQGLGDTLQMLRYARLLAAQGATVLVEVPAVLARLAATVPGVSGVVVAGAPLPAFDLHCPCMSLPLAFGTTLASVPAEVPYLFAPDPVREDWRVRLGAPVRRRVGLAWSGSVAHRNDRNRSVALERLLPLLDADAQFHSLQKEYRGGDAALLAADGRLRDWSASLGDLADTAGLVGALDLVVTVDTAVAHLAGGMGKPTWLLLPFGPDYRWLLHRADSPWYPTMRLFRQPAPGDWGAVVAAVSSALAGAHG